MEQNINRSLIEDDEKYKTKNYIAGKTIIGFINTFKNLLEPLEPSTILEAGCGTGYITERIAEMKNTSITHIKAFDSDDGKIMEAKKRVAGVDFFTGSIYEIPFSDDSFDLVVSTEVLEHLEEPDKALIELLRVSNEYLLVSVPDEPIWRITKMLRGKYLRDFGNTPGHINHWSKRRWKAFLREYCDIKIFETPFPWLMALCIKRNLNKQI